MKDFDTDYVDTLAYAMREYHATPKNHHLFHIRVAEEITTRMLNAVRNRDEAGYWDARADYVTYRSKRSAKRGQMVLASIGSLAPEYRERAMAARMKLVIKQAVAA